MQVRELGLKLTLQEESKSHYYENLDSFMNDTPTVESYATKRTLNCIFRSVGFFQACCNYGESTNIFVKECELLNTAHINSK